MKRLLLFSCLSFIFVGCVSNENQDDLNKILRLAQKARETGNPEAAVNFYKQARSIDNSNPKIFLGLSEIYIDMKLLDAAMEYLKIAESNGADINRVCYLRGKVYLLSDKTDKAEQEFKKSQSVDCLNALGTICDNKGEHEKAQHLYKMVITKDPNYIDAYNNLGLSLLLCDRYKDAIFYLENACSLPNASALYRGNLALAYGMYGDIAKAKQIYAQDFEGNALNEKIAYLEDIIAAKNSKNK